MRTHPLRPKAAMVPDLEIVKLIFIDQGLLVRGKLDILRSLLPIEIAGLRALPFSGIITAYSIKEHILYKLVPAPVIFVLALPVGIFGCLLPADLWALKVEFRGFLLVIVRLFSFSYQ